MTEPPPSSRSVAGRYQHVFWFALLLATAVTLAGVSVAVGAYLGAGDPTTVVRAYFAALGRGDAAGALGYGTVPPGRHDLLDAAVLAAQHAVAPLGDLTVRDVRDTGHDSATVDVDYTLAFASGPVAVSDAVPVVRHGHDWRLVSAAVPVSVAPGDGATLASLAGAVVPTGDYAMFPGAVPVVYDTPDLVLGAPSRLVRFADAGVLLVNADVSPAGRAAVVSAVRRALSTCLAGRGPVQALCPGPDPDPSIDSATAVPGSLRGRVTGVRPGSVVLSVDSTDGEIDIVGQATVHATYQRLDVNNLPRTVTVTTVGLHARCYATAVGTIVWAES